MSAALQSEREKTDHYIEQLSGLYQVTVSLYSIAQMQDAFREICGNIARILKVRQCILLLYNQSEGAFLPSVSVPELAVNTRDELRFTREKMEELYLLCSGMPIVRNDIHEEDPFALKKHGDLQERNFLFSWLYRKDKILGALRVSDKEGSFTEEDAKIMIILANHMAVAMENAELYKDLQDKMSELRETQEQLIQSAKLAAIGELASNVAHEINNPLTSIIGFTELSKEEEDISAIRISLDIIERESLRAREIVSQLLNFARKKPLQLTPVKINEVLRDVVMLTSSQARMSKVKIREDYGEFPVSVGDPDQLKQVFLNIVTNAICAMPEGGTLFISTSQAGEHTVIRLADTGPGISKEIMSRIFEPFFTTKKDKGTGLGLSISYRIIQDHGGRIEVESSEGQGTTFIVRLPQKLPVPAA
jgi:signal transduction histidine kinase